MDERAMDDSYAKSFAELELQKIEDLCRFFGMKPGSSIRAFINQKLSQLGFAKNIKAAE